jgi:protein gp37
MRCTPVSEGCKNCWHLALANRLEKNPMIPEDRQEAYAGGRPVLIERELRAPSKLKKPAIIGVEFMGDLFHEDVPFEYIKKVWDIASKCQQHIFLFLTKRPERMLEFTKWMAGADDISIAHWPRSCWLGITAENQQLYDERWEILVRIPATARFVSIEPMLSKIDLKLYDYAVSCGSHSVRKYFLRWVICGAESGPKRRRTKIEWIRNLKDQCVNAHAPFFLKQMEINGKVVTMPELDGVIYNQMPDMK